MIVGVAIIAVGIAATTLPVVLGDTLSLAYSVAGWVVTGLGVGLAHPASAATAFSRSPEGKEGFVSSSLLLADLFTSAVAIGVGGAPIEFGCASGEGSRSG